MVIGPSTSQEERRKAKKCAYCAEGGGEAKSCSKCHKVFYCKDSDHQKKDWPRHKLACRNTNDGQWGLMVAPGKPTKEGTEMSQIPVFLPRSPGDTAEIDLGIYRPLLEIIEMRATALPFCEQYLSQDDQIICIHQPPNPQYPSMKVNETMKAWLFDPKTKQPAFEFHHRCVLFFNKPGRDLLPHHWKEWVFILKRVGETNATAPSPESKKSLPSIFSPKPSPGENLVAKYDALLFPQSQAHPLVVKVDIVKDPKAGGVKVDANRWLGNMPFRRAKITDKPFTVVMTEGYIHDGSTPNKAIKDSSNGRSTRYWAGNILVVMQHSESWAPDKDCYRDFLGKEDLDIVTEYFAVTLNRDEV